MNRRGIFWLVLAVTIVVTASVVAIWFARRDEGERRWRLYGQGVDSFESGSYGLAAEIFQRYLDRFGDYAPARYMLGVSLYRLDRQEEAITEVRKASEHDPDLDEASVFLSRRAFERGRLRAALGYAEQALANPPAPPDAHLIAGMVLGQPELRDVTAAIDHLEAAEKAGVGTIPSQLLLVELLRDVRSAFPERVNSAHWAELTKQVDEGLREHLSGGESDASIWRLLARLALATDRLAPAQEALSNCRRLGDDSADYWVLLARASFLAGDPATGEGAVRQALGMNVPLDLVTELAIFLNERGEGDLAKRVVKRGEDLYRDQPVFVLWHVRWLMGRDRTDEADALAEAAAKRWPQDDDLALLRADVAARAGKQDAAAESLRALIAADRVVGAARLRLADLLLTAESAAPESLDQARELIEGAAGKGGQTRTEAEFLRGFLALREGRLDSAREHLGVAVSRDPMQARYHAVYADLLLRDGSPVEAEKEASAAIRLRGPLPELLLIRARAAIEAGRDSYAAARKDLIQLLDADPGNVAAVRLLARLAVSERGATTPEDLARLYRIAGAPDATARVLVAVGSCALSRGDLAEAESFAARAEAVASDVPARWDAVELRSRVLERRKESGPTAVKTYLREAGAKAKTANGRALYGWLLLEKGDAEAAVDQARSVLGEEEENVLALRLLFETCFANGEDGLDAAREVADRVAAAAPGSSDEFYVQGKLALATGRREEGRDLLKRALALSPSDYYAACFLGRALFELNEWDEAEIRLRRAVDLRPDFRTARVYLADLLFARGERKLKAEQESAAARDFLDADDLEPEDGRGALGFARAVLTEGLRDNTLLRKQARERVQRVIGQIRTGVEGEAGDLLSRCLLAESNLALLDRDWATAATAMGRYLKLHPDDEGAILHRAIALMFSGEGTDAIEELRALVTAAPESWPATALLGEAYFRADRPKEAETLFRGWLKSHEHDPSAAICLAEALRRQDRTEEVVELLAGTLADRPDSVKCAEQLVAAATTRELRGMAASALSKALETTEHASDLRYLSSQLKTRTDGGQPDVNLLERCLSGGFQSLSLEVDCYAELIRSLVDAGRRPAAVAYARRFLGDVARRIDVSSARLNPRRVAVAWEMAGVALYGEGDLDAAETCFRRALDLWPDYALAANNLAYLILDRPVPAGYAERAGDLNEAEGLARRAVRSDPKNPEYLDTLGAVLLARGKDAESVVTLRIAVSGWEQRGEEGERSLSRSLVRLGLVLARTGDLEPARSQLSRAARVWPDITRDSTFTEATEAASE